jgi:ATP-dependent Clp protease ATP-binding subunit ClpX
LVKQYKKFFGFDDIELEFTDDALDAISDLALIRGTGARGLRAICEEVLNNVMFELPSRSDVEKVVIDAEAVRNKVLPTLVPRSSTPRVTRPRRAAS